MNVNISAIEPNPLRRLKDYPYNERKLDALQRSIKEVGLWEGIIARKVGNRVQIAFGHHRVEAARRAKLDRIPVIVRELTDKQMLQFMGRENLEDYNADFLVMLETWEAAVEFLAAAEKPVEPVEVARLLGWVDLGNRGGKLYSVMNDTAVACNAAAKLIKGSYIKRNQLEDLTVRAVREICARIIAQQETVERMAAKTQRPAAEVEETKKIIGRAGGRVANKVRAGKVAHTNIRGEVDAEAFATAKEAKKQMPLFSLFGKSLIDQVDKVATKYDSIGQKFHEIKGSLNQITERSDVEIVKKIAFACELASKRFDDWQTTFTNPKTKVVKLKAIENRRR
jgi:hypothetical protein